MGNKLNIELEGKYVILDKKYISGETDIDRMFFCRDGFGCSPVCNGSAIFGHFTIDAEECRIEGHKVKRLATAEEIAQAKFPQPLSEQQKLQKLLLQLQHKKEMVENQITETEKRLIEEKRKG